MAERTENKGSTEFQHEDVDNEMQNKTAHCGMILHSRRSFIAASALLGASIAFGAQRKDNNINGLIINSNKTMRQIKCKITVLRRELYQDLQEQYLADPKSGKCPFFYEGQEFIVDNEGFFRMLNGQFCSEAWDCISRYVYAALQGGSIMRDWTNDEKMMITCCNDGTRPVIFKIERIDE